MAASDYLKTLPNLISRWTPRRLASLGTDGFGRSEGRAACAISLKWTRASSRLPRCHELLRDGKIEACVVEKASRISESMLDKPNPLFA